MGKIGARPCKLHEETQVTQFRLFRQERSVLVLVAMVTMSIAQAATGNDGSQLQLSGSINKTMKIEMTLQFSKESGMAGEKVAGTYFYLKKKTKIALDGESNAGEMTLRESVEGKETGAFRGDFEDAALKEIYSGVWSSPDKKRAYLFELRKIGAKSRLKWKTFESKALKVRFEYPVLDDMGEPQVHEGDIIFRDKTWKPAVKGEDVERHQILLSVKIRKWSFDEAAGSVHFEFRKEREEDDRSEAPIGWYVPGRWMEDPATEFTVGGQKAMTATSSYGTHHKEGGYAGGVLVGCGVLQGPGGRAAAFSAEGYSAEGIIQRMMSSFKWRD